MRRLGNLIVLLGLGLTAFSAFFVFTKEKVVNIENLEIVSCRPLHLQWSALIGIT